MKGKNKQTRAFLEKKKLDTTIDEYEAQNPPLRKIDHSEEVKVDSNKVIIDCLTNIISNASNALNEVNKK